MIALLSPCDSDSFSKIKTRAASSHSVLGSEHFNRLNSLAPATVVRSSGTTMPALNIDDVKQDVPSSLGEDVRGELKPLYRIKRGLAPLTTLSLVLGYDPLIPPQLLQSEVPAVRSLPIRKQTRS